VKKIKQIPEFDRPREKMVKNGPKNLSNQELIAILLGSGIKGRDVFEVSREIVHKTEKDFKNLTLKNLMKIDGVGKAKACQIMAAIEFSKRFLIKEEKKITGPEDIVSLVQDLRKKKQEHFVTLTLDGAHNLIKKRTVFIGTLNQSLVHPREVFADAISDRAAAVILIHNHPSGNVEPSELDVSLTKRLIKAGELLGIEVLDHIIIGKDKHSSFKEIKLI